MHIWHKGPRAYMAQTYMIVYAYIAHTDMRIWHKGSFHTAHLAACKIKSGVRVFCACAYMCMGIVSLLFSLNNWRNRIRCACVFINAWILVYYVKTYHLERCFLYALRVTLGYVYTHTYLCVFNKIHCWSL